MITVFTPTYNRKNNLSNLYKSLLNQKYKDFEWLIVDDGSTDDTAKFIKEIQEDNKIKIRYFYKKNGGKMSAVNKAHELALGEGFITIDSDDELNYNALNELSADLKIILNKNDIAGIVYLAAYKTSPNNHIGDLLPEDNTICKYIDLSVKYKIKGDKATLWKTSVLKDYKFPIIDNEKFIPDLYLMMQISKKYNIITSNKIIMLVEYLNDGFSNNYFKLVKKNPKGTSLYYLELYYYDKRLFNIYAYILFSIYAKKEIKTIIKEHPSKIKILLLYFPTWVVSKIK